MLSRRLLRKSRTSCSRLCLRVFMVWKGAFLALNLSSYAAGHKELSQAQSAKVGKLTQREGNPVFSPSRLLAAVCKAAPQFKVCCA